MYLGVDIGGTKTLVASLNNDGVITEQFRFLTPQNYRVFLTELEDAISGLKAKKFKAATVAVPAVVMDRSAGTTEVFSNLSWKSIKIEDDVAKIVGCPVIIENDAKLAGLSEAMMLKDKYSRVLYITVSTGIGYAFINNRVIDDNSGDGGGRTLMIERSGKHIPWEDLISGPVIVKKYGKMAKDITDKEIWRSIAKDLATGLVLLVGSFEPEVIVFGGGVGNYFSRFGKMLANELAEAHIPLIAMPKLKVADRPDEAVIYGCYDYAKQVFSQNG